MSEIAALIADLVAAGVHPELVGRVAAALTGKKARTQKIKNAYSADFEAFWKAYPTDANMSKFEAWEEWQKTNQDERRLALEAAPKFRDYCKANPDYRPVHAVRFLRKKRFEGHAAQPDLKLVASNPGVYVMQDSPEWADFAAAYRAEKGKAPPVDKRGGWFFTKAG